MGRESEEDLWAVAWNLSPSLLTKAPLALSAFVCAQLLWFGNQEYRTGCYKKVERWKPSIDVLPEIVEAVEGKVEVFLDGGVRKGTDVLKALALGAKAVFVGRPIIWGLASQGEKGVQDVLEILKEEFWLAMALSGCQNVKVIDKTLVRKNLLAVSKI
eukprot:bmy_15692T0